MHTKKLTTWLAAAACAFGLLGAAQAQDVKVEGAWVRASVPGQSGTGGFMTLTAPVALRLVGVATPVAATAEVHEMRMDGEVMRMRALDGLDLPAGTPVQLKPGGYHLMLTGLRQALAKGTTVPLTLLLRDAQGVERQQALTLPVATVAPGAAAAPKDAADHSHHGH
ncbi:copper chaperone PCu(A)C [Xylophilus sp. GW821-FHT01B05]